MAELVAGFTKKQREFFLEAFGHRCAFHWKVNGRWVRCQNTRQLEVHHIYPRGWCKENMGINFHVNGSEQGIVLCRHHHWQVHPDMIPASVLYREGNKKAYEDMMSVRKNKNRNGIPYWDTKWDLLFIRLNRKFVGKYTAKNRVKYPNGVSRGLNGRKKV